MAMTNMKMDKPEGEMEEDMDMDDQYPYGLCICLTQEDLDKLGIPVPRAGDKFVLNARVTATRVSESQEEGEEAEASVSLQVTDMELTKESSAAKAATMLYSKE